MLHLVASFEYYDIAITLLDVEILQHMGHKNNDCINYNHTFVYSVTRDGYTVSIIMKTRQDDGSAMDSIQREYRTVKEHRLLHILNEFLYQA